MVDRHSGSGQSGHDPGRAAFAGAVKTPRTRHHLRQRKFGPTVRTGPRSGLVDLRAPEGRAVQMDTATKVATGDYRVFLHERLDGSGSTTSCFKICPEAESGC